MEKKIKYYLFKLWLTVLQLACHCHVISFNGYGIYECIIKYTNVLKNFLKRCPYQTAFECVLVITFFSYKLSQCFSHNNKLMALLSLPWQ